MMSKKTNGKVELRQKENQAKNSFKSDSTGLNLHLHLH